ncbi:similar to Saccharomyces cerevisiae YDR279W RNH202 Ribonuclease H2 subunit, required for RNase H2 activity [Maudiozyma saulgeensis]|uniref:Similar to Saccharomyces cerevisiae YDR279W RNH202 Ribonuclease H2 subunit, required for RNase H2 activity n=1 Tax=Maudiozyma saulgeensis TaxID=1789683 RepID=A0A1X7R587_9SACH|nr:similar to Saccharomyces cerevisiae YDR279W RNH202 Ribonuclease H2 subunit, required for RNase H2 activity [Kazachstania saulgeensis]
MTSKEDFQQILLLPKDVNPTTPTTTTLSLCHPSLTSGKPSLELLIHEDKIYHFDQYTFRSKYLVDANHTGPRRIVTARDTSSQEVTSARSVFVINSNSREDGLILSRDTLKLLLVYDITYSLIAAYCKAQNDPMTSKEKDYLTTASPSSSSQSNNESDRFLTIRDYRDMLIEQDSSEWNHIPMSIIENKLCLISEQITECDELYYKTTLISIVRYLITEKICKMYSSFPESIPIPSQWPTDIQKSMKIVRCCQLLISLLPRRIYEALTQEDTIVVLTIDDDKLSVKKCFTKVEKYRDSTAVSEQERKLLAQSAMQVGLSNGSAVKKTGNKIKKPSITKKSVTKKKVTVGKGAIDGFFKKR